MPKRYTPEMKAFIEANVKGRYYAELAELMTEHFGETFTAGQMHAYAKNHHLSNGMPTGTPPGKPSKVYPPEIAEFIRDNVTGTETRELTRLINERFGTNYGVNQIKAYKTNHHLRNGLDFRIKPGTPPPNKGRKGYYAPGCEKGRFTKGHTPHNHVEVGTETWTTDGYLKVKIAEPNKWKLKHVLVWEEANGPVPKGKAIVFLDGDHANVTPENLTLVSRAELARLNQDHLIRTDAELTKAGVLVARLKTLTGQAKKKRSKKTRRRK